MNFLLHRHLARRDLGSVEAGLGAMLPDLWRMADRHLRLRPPIGDPPTEEPATHRVLLGVAHHLRLDHAFHNAEVFLQGERRLVDRMRQADLRAPKMSLLAHAGWELCLDGALIRRHGAQPLLRDLRQDLGQAWSAIDSATTWVAERRNRPNPDRALRRLWTDLTGPHWIAGYGSGPGLARRLAGIRRRLGLPPLQDAEMESLHKIMEASLADAEADLPRVLKLSASALDLSGQALADRICR